MWINVLGWIATAVFSVSYFCKSSNALRTVQAGAATLWIAYGLAMKSAPVVVANVIVAVAAIYATLRARKAATRASADEFDTVS